MTPQLRKGRQHFASCRRVLRSLDATAAFAFLFELLTATLSVADVIADVLVAAQFYRDGHTVWAAAVCASLFVSSVVYAMVFCESLCVDPVMKHYFGDAAGFHNWSAVDRAKVYAASFPLSQFLPTIVWGVGVLHEHGLLFAHIPKATNKDTTEADRGWATLVGESSESPTRPNGGNDRERTQHRRSRRANRAAVSDANTSPSPEQRSVGASMSAAVLEETERCRAGALLMRRVHASLDHHIRTHTLFYVETVVEAIPQALIQLLAMTYAGTNGGGPTTLQVFSLGMSLTTICSKAYLVSVTFDLRALVFKAALAVHDLFSLFYLYSTLLAPRHESSSSFDLLGLGVPFGFMGTVWLLRLVIGLAVVFAAGACFFVVRMLQPSIQLNRQEVQGFITGILMGSILIVPATIVMDATKLAWLTVLDTMNLPAAQMYPFLSALLSFVRNGQSPREVHERVMHVAHIVAMKERQYNVSERARFSGAQHAWYRGLLTEKIAQSEAVAAVTTGRAMETTWPWTTRFVSVDNPTGCVRRAVRQVVAAEDAKGLASIMIGVVAGYYGTTQCVMLFFPLLNIAIEGLEYQNPLQLFAAAVCAVCLCVALVLWPAVSPYLELTAAVDIGYDWSHRSGVDYIEEALDTIHAFVVPTPSAVVTAVTPHCVVSRVVSELVVGPYLPASAVDMALVTSDECRSLRRALHRD